MASEGLNKETRFQEAGMWQERYRVLFDRNVAGAILTNVEGRILDCNEPCARIFGFDSRRDMLAHSAWDFYFDKADREDLIARLRSRADCLAEEVCYLRVGMSGGSMVQQLLAEQGSGPKVDISLLRAQM